MAGDDIEAMFADDGGGGGGGGGYAFGGDDDDDAGFEIIVSDEDLPEPEGPEDGFEIIVDDAVGFLFSQERNLTVSGCRSACTAVLPCIACVCLRNLSNGGRDKRDDLFWSSDAS